jgi:fatty-acyl-CoA synthase
LIVVTQEGVRVSAEELRAHLLKYVPKWWLPDEIAFARELPHGPTGKLQKEEIRRRVTDGIIVPVAS